MIRAIVISAIVLLASGCQGPSGPPVEILDVEVTAPRGGMGMSAGYLSITNNSDALVSITRVASPQYGKIELHESTLVDGVARMRPVESLEIAAGDTVTLERGGKHLMLMQPADSLDNVTLNFYSGDALLVSIETRVGEAG